MSEYYVYILTNQARRPLYVGVTNNIHRRLEEHRTAAENFVRKYHLDKLVYVEETDTVTDAIAREKQLKHWTRDWKLQLIASQNPTFDDLLDPRSGASSQASSSRQG